METIAPGCHRKLRKVENYAGFSLLPPSYEYLSLTEPTRGPQSKRTWEMSHMVQYRAREVADLRSKQQSMGNYGVNQKAAPPSSGKSTILRTQILELGASSIMYDRKETEKVSSLSSASGSFLQICGSYMIHLSSVLQLPSGRMHVHMLVNCEPPYEYSGVIAESGANALRKFSFALRQQKYGTTINNPKKTREPLPSSPFLITPSHFKM